MKKYVVLGMMSGTSLDGLDMALVQFSKSESWAYKLLGCKTVPYKEKLYKQLESATQLSGLELKKLDIKYGKWIGEQARGYIEVNNITPDLVVSHGHTIFHQPEIGLTHQIGDGARIATITGINTINDLRSLDVALGGQGAPLVPVGDKLLFGEFDFCLNIGGFSNISFDFKGERKAFDICPANTVLNYLSNKIEMNYDDGGEIAKSGQLNISVLNKLNAIEYYNKIPPKSLGIEWVQKYIFPLLVDDSEKNLLNTFCHHIAQQVNLSITNNVLNRGLQNRLLITGGGAKNSYLIELIRKYSPEKLRVIIPDEQVIDFKEAIIFGFLGLLKTLSINNTLKSVTGAISDSCGGLLYNPVKKTSM